MPCSCGSGSTNSAPQSYTVRAADGTVTSYSSEVEAAAAAQRQGGTYRAA